ncbi:MAG: hypothetical protein ACI9VR_001671 [Cognaticolwellia sp.]|jgi:uncharacterized protein
MKRLTGLDFARSAALMGMVLVNIPLAFSAHETDLAGWLSGAFSGRAAAVFVVLAGVSNSLMTRKAIADPARAQRDRRTIFRRALFLGILGLAWLPLWPADILHYYGIWMALSALLFTQTPKRLLAIAAVVTLIFPLLLIVGPDYETGWNWANLDYEDFWTSSGFVRNLFYNGLHPVFPWFAFFLGGMWLGRQNLADPDVRRRLLTVLVPLWLATEALARGLIWGLLALGENAQDAVSIGGIDPMPPMPWYILGAGSAAMAFILVCIPLAQRFPRAVAPWVHSGQMALTHYASHVFLLLYPLLLVCDPAQLDLAYAPLVPASGPLLLGAMALWAALSVAFSHLWRRWFDRGPLEWLMRTLTQPRTKPPTEKAR